jgi:hypothetical protein
MFVLQSLGDACEIRVAFDTDPLSGSSSHDSCEYFDSIADFERWLEARQRDAGEIVMEGIVSVTMRTTIDLEDVLLGYHRIDGFPGATMQYDGTVLIVSVTDPATLGEAFNKAFQVTTPVYDEGDLADADDIVAAGRATAVSAGQELVPGALHINMGAGGETAIPLR